MLSNECSSVVYIAKLDKAVHCFCRWTLHDDVNAALIRALKDAFGTAHKVKDLVFCDGIRDLSER